MRALNDAENEADIPLTSLIDVVFLLLIFFLVATTFTRKELDQKVQLPRSEAGEKAVAAPENLIVNIREDGALVVNGRRLDEDGLRHELREWRAAHPDRPAAVRGDARVPYQAVMRVLGVCKAEGVVQVDLPVLEPEADA
jgi:biopolymer transport protein ExbD